MSKTININAASSAVGGIGVGVMTAAGNPWTVADALADELVNRGLAKYSPTPAVIGEIAAVISSVTAAYFATLTTGGEPGTIYEIADQAGHPQWRWNGTTFVAVGGGGTGGATTFAALTDAASVDLVATNTALAAALATKVPILAPYALTGDAALVAATHYNRSGSWTGTVAGTITIPNTGNDGDFVELSNDSATVGLTFAGPTAAAGMTNVAAFGTTYQAKRSNGAWKSVTAAIASTADKTLVNAAAGAAPAIDLSKYNVADLTLTANCTPVFSGAVAGQAFAVQLIIRTGAGGFTLTLPTVKWVTGTALALSATAAKVASFTLQTVDGGTTWLGYLSGNGA